ncbi:peptide-N4-asparagine amidase [Stackebrandtia soli]|uniref:peptide-N4-asparagine amidase n=1 Tax=Stackebrandtia soli TaxID=1892856 RepID=UPI0039EC872D
MRGLSALVAAALAVTTFSPVPAHAGNVPPEFGDDWDDPRTAAPPIDTPDVASCEVPIVDHRFDDFEPFTGTFVPPTECGDEWSMVVLRLDGSVAGRQYDRLGQLDIGGVPVFKTSTPEPSPQGITWSVERDVTQYAPLLASTQPTLMSLGNVVDDVHDGVLDVRVSLTFYEASSSAPAPDVPDRLLPLSDQDDSTPDLRGTLTVPTNSERLIADVYATGSGGGCEEFWYLTAPPQTGYSCAAPDGPYREVQVLIDGQIAGIAAPYPHIYTGGWSNPYLWYTIPAPRAFDLEPLRYDLTPYLGLLNDGAAHDVAVRVVGMPADAAGWSTPVAFRVWQDEESQVVNGGVLTSETTPLTNDITILASRHTRVQVEAGRQHTATGWLETSHGSVMTTVDRTIGNMSTHSWAPGENPDALRAEWFDMETRTVLSNESDVDVTQVDRTFSVNGRIGIDDENRLTTTITLLDEREVLHTAPSGRVRHLKVRDSFLGAAAFDIDQPRPDRRGVGVSQNRYVVVSDTAGTCYDRVIRSRNGYVTIDRDRC